MKGLNPVKGFLGAIGDKASDLLPTFQPFASANSPELASTQGLGLTGSPPSSQVQNNAVNNVDVRAPITVQVPEGTPVSEIGPRIENGVNTAIRDLLRTTFRANQTQTAF